MQGSLFDQTGSPEDSHAKTFRWLDDVLDWLESAADSGSSSAESSEFSGPAGFSSKTSLAFCRPTEEGTWEPSSGRWGNWGMGGPTASLTLSGSEFPRDAVACSLSDVLETGDVPQKYFLSERACRGILRRAAKRGKKLPAVLEQALREVAGETTLIEQEHS